MNLLFKLSLIPSSALGAALIYKTFFRFPVYNGNEDLTDKVAIVTGSTSGIGKEIAFKLAMRNATVIMGCRDMYECKSKRLKIIEKSENKNVYCAELDLESNSSIKDFVRRLRKKYNRVDLLINNAGYKGGKKREVSKEFIEKQLAVNAMGHFLLTKLLLPFLIEAKPSRVLFLICPHYKLGTIDTTDINQETQYDNEKAFNQSQLFKMLLVKYFSDSIPASTVSFNACDPGPTYSNFYSNSNYNRNFISRTIFKYVNMLFLRDTWQAVETPIMCLVSNELSEESGSLYRDLQKIDIDTAALDTKMANFVYQVCDKWTGRDLSKSAKV